MDLKVYYQNVHGLRTKTLEFSENLMICDYDVLLLCETGLNDGFHNAELFDDRYTVYRCDRDPAATLKSRGGGCIIAVKKVLDSVRLVDWEVQGECIWVEVRRTGCKKIFFRVSYIPPLSTFDLYKAHFDNIMDIVNVREPDSEFFIMGDFNLPSIFWIRSTDGSYVPTCHEGRSATELVNTLDLCNLNQFNSVDNHRGRRLDLVLSNVNSCKINLMRATDLLIHEENHHPALEIILNLPLSFFTQPYSQTKPDFKRADFVKINRYIQEVDWNERLACDDVDRAVSIFYESMKPVLNDIPSRKAKKPCYPSWFSERLIRMIREKASAKLRYSKSKNIIDYNIFSSMRRQTKYEIRACRRRYTANIEEAIPNNTKNFFSYVKSLSKNDSALPNKMTLNGDCGADDQTIADLFATYFSSVYVSTSAPSSPLPHDVPIANTPALLFPISEIQDLLKSLDVKKATSPDGLPNFFLRETAHTISIPLAIIFNLSLSSGIFPSIWKTSHVVPIFKNGNRTDVTNYRPISILCAVSKVLERFMHNQVFESVKDQISVRQHGFMPKRSTTTNLMEFTDFLSESIIGGGQVDTIYSDFSKAFDKVNHHLLLVKLRAFGLGSRILTLIESYLSSRKQYVSVNKVKSHIFLQTSGIPQGSIFGPLLFLLFINDLNLHCNFSLFADDLKLWKIVRCLEDSLALQNDVDRLASWCLENCLLLNIRKCFVVTYTRKFSPLIFTYKILNSELIRKNTINDLGITFDSKLSFEPHISTIMRSAFRMLGFIMRATKGFQNHRSVLILYFAYVRSKLEYCSPAWNPHYGIYIDQLERVQRRLTRMLVFRLGIPYECYSHRLKRFGLHSLETRRLIADELMLYKIANSLTQTSLLHKLRFTNPVYFFRNAFVFYLPSVTTNVEYFSPHLRFQRAHNDLFGDVNLFTDSITSFKRLIWTKIT